MFLFHFHFWKIVLLGKKFIFSCCCEDFVFQHFYYDVSGCEFLCYYPNWNLLSKFHEYGTTFHVYVVYSFSSVGNFSTIIPSNVISVSFSSPHSISITHMFMCLKVSHIFLRLCSIFHLLFSLFFNCLISTVNSRSWWWTGRPGVLQFMGSQRVGHNWATDLIWSGL